MLGEVGNATSSNRRIVGHGNLAEKALKNVMPSFTDFPYVIRLYAGMTLWHYDGDGDGDDTNDDSDHDDGDTYEYDDDGDYDHEYDDSNDDDDDGDSNDDRDN